MKQYNRSAGSTHNDVFQFPSNFTGILIYVAINGSDNAVAKYVNHSMVQCIVGLNDSSMWYNGRGKVLSAFCKADTGNTITISVFGDAASLWLISLS